MEIFSELSTGLCFAVETEDSSKARGCWMSEIQVQSGSLYRITRAVASKVSDAYLMEDLVITKRCCAGQGIATRRSKHQIQNCSRVLRLTPRNKEGWSLEKEGGDTWTWKSLFELPADQVVFPGICRSEVDGGIYVVGGGDYDNRTYWTESDRNGGTFRLGLKCGDFPVLSVPAANGQSRYGNHWPSFLEHRVLVTHCPVSETIFM